MNKLFRQHPDTAAQKQMFSTALARIQKENNQRLELIREKDNLIQKLRKKINDPVLADSVRADTHRSMLLLLEEMKAMERERVAFITRRQRALELRKQAGIQKILEKLQERIMHYAKHENLDFVLDRAGSSSNRVPILLYNKDAFDITSTLIEMNTKKTAAR